MFKFLVFVILKLLYLKVQQANKQAMFTFQKISLSNRCYAQNLSYENDFHMQENKKIIFVSVASHLA